MSKMTRSECGKLGALKSNARWQENYAKNPSSCKYCKEILPYQKRKNTFCNQSCAASHNNTGTIKSFKRIEEYEKNPFHCKYCNKIIPYNKKRNIFCDKLCSYPYNNTIIGGTIVKNGDCKYKKCIGCDQEIIDKIKNKYCTPICKAKKIRELRTKHIEEVGFENSVLIAKRYLLETRGVKCEICNNVEWRGAPIPLVMDHIDGHSENNQLTNLRLVCGNCDMQLPTYKSKNKGKGRASRRKRYAEGKSY